MNVFVFVDVCFLGSVKERHTRASTRETHLGLPLSWAFWDVCILERDGWSGSKT